MHERTCYCGMCILHLPPDMASSSAGRRLMTDRDHFKEPATEMPTPLSVLYSVVDDARRYDAYLEKNP